MVKRTRIIIFLVCSFLFILIAPSAVLYSQGYRFDLNPPAGGIKLTQTGGLFLKTIPKQADVYIDGKLNKRTDFFFGSALIENLLPKKFKVEVKKERYHSWEKSLEIKEKKVTEVKNIILFPQNVNFSVLSSKVERFWFSPDQRKIILLEEEEKSGWALKLYDLDKNIKSHLMDKDNLPAKETQLLSLTFSEDSKKIYLEVSTGQEEKEKIQYFTIEEFDKAKPLLVERESPFSPPKDAIVYLKNNNALYYLDNFGHLFKSNEEKLTAAPFPIKKEAEYALEIFQDFIFLVEESKFSSPPFAGAQEREGDNLYKFNPELKVFENFFERINFLKISPDNKKIVYFSDYEIWILFLSDKNDPPQIKAGEKLFLIRLSEKITDVAWLNSNYLIFGAGDKIKISEIDNRDKLNIVDIFEIKKLSQNGNLMKISWNQFDKKIYILNGGNLYISNPLLP